MVKLTKDLDSLWRLVREAKSDRLPFDQAFRKVEDMFVSRHYGSAGDAGKQNPENVPFAVASLLLPQMVQSAPRYFARADGTFHNEVFAAGSVAALNLVARRGMWHRILRPGAFDYLNSYPAFFVEMSPQRHASVPDAVRSRLKGALAASEHKDDAPIFQSSPMNPAPPHWPAVRHIQRERWGWDLKARSYDEARFVWWETTYSIEHLKDLAKREPKRWHKGAIGDLQPSHDTEHLGHGGGRYSGGSGGRAEDRNEVVVFQVWVPEDEIDGKFPEPGERGVIYTFTVRDGSGQQYAHEIARPYYFYGPPCGPIVTGGQYTVSMESVPLNMLVANMEQVNLVNAVAWAVGNRIKKHKRVYAYDMAIDGDIRAMAQRADGQFQGVTGLVRDSQAAIIPIDMGGVDRADVAHLQLALDGVSRAVLGADESLRGQIGSGSTATEVATATSSTAAKVEFILQGWEQIVVDLGNAVRWYIEHDSRFFAYLDSEGKEAIRRRQAQPLVDGGLLTPYEVETALQRSRSTPYPFQGGDLTRDDAGMVDPSSVEVELEVGSMARKSSAQRRAEESALTQEIAYIAQMAVQAPHVDWKQRLKSLGEAWGRPGLENLLDEEVASQVAGIQLMGGLPDARFEGFGDAARGPGPRGPGVGPRAGSRPGRAQVAAQAAPERRAPVSAGVTP